MITLYGRPPAPNPLKINILLRELGLRFTASPLGLSDVKGLEYTSINPNGRYPAIHDARTGVTLWESGAIIDYLIDTYDSEQQRLSFPPRSVDAYHAKQWLHFQTSGQGPYYGQYAWFEKFHDQRVPSAIDRYAAEINRVTGVLEAWLEKQSSAYSSGDGPWLVGNKLSYADLAFVPYQRLAGVFATKEQYDIDRFPRVKAWLEKMLARQSVQEALQDV